MKSHTLQNNICKDASFLIPNLLLLSLLSLIFLLPCPAPAQTVPPNIRYERELSYRPGGGVEWNLDYAMPLGAAQPLPAIVVIHGGGWIEGDKSSYDELIMHWATLGFFAMTINYRLADADTKAFPEAVEDCKCAVRWLRANAAKYNVDKERIAAYGSSAGGHLALMLGLLSKGRNDDYEGDGPHQDQSSDVCAVISDSGIVTLDPSLPGNTPLLKDFVEFLGGSPPPTDQIQKSSPLSYVERAPQMPPMLLLYGAADTSVPIEQVEQFVAALRAHGHPNLTYRRYESAGHCPFFMEHTPGAQEEVEKFLLRVLKPER